MSINFTVIQTEQYGSFGGIGISWDISDQEITVETGIAEKNDLESIALVKVRNGKIIKKKVIDIFPERFSESWEQVAQFIENDVIVSRDARKVTKILGACFRAQGIPEPKLFSVCCAKLTTKCLGNRYYAYNDLANALGFDPIKVESLKARAEFIAKCVIKMLTDYNEFTIENIKEIADFSPANITTKNIGDYKTSSIRDINEIIKKPKDQRFEGCYFAFTGTLKVEGKKSLQRKAAMEIIKNMGGHSTESFDQNVTHLVKGIIREKEIEANGMTGKEIKLMEWNSLGKDMVIISAEDFMRLIET